MLISGEMFTLLVRGGYQ